MTPAPARIPPLPVLSWGALLGPREAHLPSLLTLAGVQFTTSGRAAILLALEALGVGHGQRVLLPTYHCPTMVAPVVTLGAAPVFYPLDDSGAPQLEWLNQCDLRGVRAIIVAHYFGLPQPMAALRAWCDRHGLALIEDCAHALFVSSGGRAIGAWGDMAIGSLVKFLPVPEGGCLIINGALDAPRLVPPGPGAEVRAVVDTLDAAARYQRLYGMNGLVIAVLSAWRRLRGSSGVTSAASATTASVPPPRIDSPIDTLRAHRLPTRTARFLARHLPRQRVVDARRARYAELARRLAGHSGLHPLLPQLPADCAPTSSRFGWTHPTPPMLNCASAASPSSAGTGSGRARRPSTATPAGSGRITCCNWLAIRHCLMPMQTASCAPWSRFTRRHQCPPPW